MRIYGAHRYVTVILDTNQQAGGKTYIKNRRFPICDKKIISGFDGFLGETSKTRRLFVGAAAAVDKLAVKSHHASRSIFTHDFLLHLSSEDRFKSWG